MSQKELARQAVLEKINRKELTMKAGAKLLEISKGGHFHFALTEKTRLFLRSRALESYFFSLKCTLYPIFRLPRVRILIAPIAMLQNSGPYPEVSMIAYNILSQRTPLCKMHLDNTPSREKLFFSNTFCEATLSGATSASIRTILRSLKPTVIAALTASVPYPWPQYFFAITYPSSALQDLAPSPLLATVIK